MITIRLSRLFVSLLIFVVPSVLMAQVPGAPTNPVPADQAVLTGNQLAWTAGANTNTYDVALGDSDTTMNSITATPITLTSVTIGQTLTSGKTYSWKITAHNATGSTTAGPFHFTVSSASSLAIPATAADATSFLKNMGFGVALGLQVNFSKPDIVTDATVDANGIVRVNTRANTSPGFLLEMHYLVKDWTYGKDQKVVGVGPFVAVQPGGTNQIISSVGAGAMVNWKVSSDTKTRTGFGIGVGYASIPSAKTLGDEFVANTPAPVGPGGQPLPVRFETRDKGSFLAILSFTF